MIINKFIWLLLVGDYSYKYLMCSKIDDVEFIMFLIFFILVFLDFNYM